MSEFAGTSNGVQAMTGSHPVTEPGAPEPAHESYAFACMRCGHGWEQSYEITHHTDAEGRPFVIYYADGQRVTSPLTHPTCLNCGEHVVRIMRSGRVKQIADALHRPAQRAVPATEQAPAGPVHAGGPEPADSTPHERHWHLSDILHPFQHRR
ncbi:hypothetical protein [Streptomyces sp. ISL-11]|uniref:hypothetical protein n=1 Tax=Streptomyces sp. ISL-11 TaxID=2819174 RepID=UPI001BE9FD3C|nr:hypothetical protein [Streptomyces sp. ISL-11]MBT2383158.1 hypothetical protein [Streptomyces sp. ISL-11]